MISEKSNNKNTVNLLWTGGWDSTFRLLQIVLEERKAVQPCYIIFKDRWSWKKEIETMGKIKKLIHENYPHTVDLIIDTFIIREEEVLEDDYLIQIFKNFKSLINFGAQYKTIVCFAEQFKMDNLELGIKKHGRIYKQIKPYILKTNSAYRIDNNRVPDKIYDFYKYFTFPLFAYSDKEMVEIASTNGWQNILGITWICHKPIFGKFLCGGCNPCIIATEDEFKKNRIPLISRIIGPYLKKVYNSKYFTMLFR